MLGIAKLFKVAVLKWVRQYADNIELPKKKAKIVQIDELWHFINGKKTKFGFGVPLSRKALFWQDTDLKKLIDQSDCDFVTDEWGGFFRCLPENRHFYGKDLTFPIEATNSDIRHRLARFKRRTKA